MINIVTVLKLLRRLPELIEFMDKHRPVLEKLAATVERFDDFIEQVGDQLDNIDKAAQLITTGYAQAMQFSSQFSVLPQTVESVEAELTTALAAVKTLQMSPAIGSHEINRKNESLAVLQDQIDNLNKRKEELNAAQPTR